MRFFILVSMAVLLAFSIPACSKKEQPATGQEAREPTAPESKEKTAPPSKPPYQLDDPDEKDIDRASDRPQLYVLSPKESVEKLAEYQAKLAKCDEDLAKKKDSCKARFATLYCMLAGDRHMEQGKPQEAVNLYLEAVKRTFTEHMGDMSAFDAEQKKSFDSATGETGRKATAAYGAARFHYQAYKDFAEIARYQKRIIETLAKKGDEAKAQEQWKNVEESVKSSASYKKEFLKDWETLKALKEKIPAQYMNYYNEIAELASSMKIEPI